MRKLSWLATALIAVPGLSYAQAGGEDFFSKHDKDGDGKVTLAEIEAVAQAQLEAADANHDGILSVEELNTARAQERFSALDKDQSGGVSLEEFQAQPGGRGMRGGMGGRDEDGDGNISVAELTSGAKRMFERADADQDGALTPEELQAARPQRRGPGGQGAEGEGQGPGAEGEGRGRRGRGGRGGPGGQGGQGGGAWAEQAFKRLDADNSGELSLEELQAAQNQRGGRGEGRGGRGGRGRGGRGGSDREI